jgi:hypothetical protein
VRRDIEPFRRADWSIMIIKRTFMRRALELARRHMNCGGGGPFGAVTGSIMQAPASRRVQSASMMPPFIKSSSFRSTSDASPPSDCWRRRRRKGIAEWLVQRLFEDVPTLAGIGHAFSFSNAPCPALLPIP